MANPTFVTGNGVIAGEIRQIRSWSGSRFQDPISPMALAWQSPM